MQNEANIIIPPTYSSDEDSVSDSDDYVLFYEEYPFSDSDEKIIRENLDEAVFLTYSIKYKQLEKNEFPSTRFDEFKRMRDVNVINVHNLSLYNFLATPIKKLIRYMRNEEFVKFFESGIIEDKFPLSSFMVMRRFKMVKEERNLIDSSSVALQNFIFSVHKIHLPDLVIYEIIVNLLQTEDRKKLLEL